MEGSVAAAPSPSDSTREVVVSVVIRFAGDSGDGIQITGGQFTLASALAGNDLATFPDFPAEIRAPTGTTFGVSAFQINFSANETLTAGDAPDVLVALNPAALITNLPDLVPHGMLIVDRSAFTPKNLRKAGYDSNPLDDGTLDEARTIAVEITTMTLEAVKPHGLSQKEAVRCKNMWTLGLIMWLYDRDRQPTIDALRAKFRNRPEIAEANVAALNAGHVYAETAELPSGIHGYQVPKAKISPGLYRTVTGSEAIAWGLTAGARAAGLKLFLGSYPITPASPLLHILSRLRRFGVVTFQAEDEIAAVCSAIGASFAGALGITSSSGPGIALKTEAIGLAIATELPLVIVNTQRAGPSTGLPTKTEQSDLFQAIFGRNADSPLVVLCSRTPGDCFDTAIEAVRLATKYMTPVILLSDGYLANASEPWLIPDAARLPKFPVTFRTDPEGFQPFQRDPETLARAWAVPGTPGLEHRIGGIEKAKDSGNISYDANNHQYMTDLRARKIADIADDIPEQDISVGDAGAKLVMVGWGSTYGAIREAVTEARNDGLDVAHVQIRYLSPLPRNLGTLLASFGQVIVPEMNAGQLVDVLRAEYLVPAKGLNQVNGQPFKVSTLMASIRQELETA